MYGGAQVLDSRSDVVAGSGYNDEYKYADQLLFPDPRTAQIVPWQAGHARFICSAYSVDGTPLRGLAAAAAGAGARRPRQEMGYAIKTGMEYENYFLNADGTPLFGGYHIFNPSRMHVPPGRARSARHAAEGRRRPDHGQRGVRARASSSSTSGPGDGLEGPDTSYTFKNAVKEIARKPRADRHLHVEADQRRWPAAARTSTSRCSTRRRASR